MTNQDSRVENSILADAPDDATEMVADLVVAGTETRQLTPAELGRMLVRIGRSVVDEEDLLELLQQVVEIAHEAIDGADSSGVTIDMGGRTYTAVHTDERTLKVDTEQYDANEGPCLHAARTGEVVLVDAEEAREQFPRFCAAARAQGIRSFLAAPLFTNEQSVGSFNLYGRDPAAFDSLDAEILDLLTTTVSRTIGDFARYKSASRVAETIQGALENRAAIEQAKGMLMALHGIDAGAAFDMLRQESQAKNIRLHVIASDLVQRLSRPTGASSNGSNGSSG
ncbi:MULTISPECIES: GAF and ANTAR domain-containing protein [unclassified Mycobacterium]|uniref:GAF and ANTAR domain-containing protein n=1 Tax=unclassified Mycobacterium TaxID=2642494 RepID=UPI0029C68D83|nr:MULTISPECIES: GAF and ANTAR domain-containing protein [unclassified Mycobacterium]